MRRYRGRGATPSGATHIGARLMEADASAFVVAQERDEAVLPDVGARREHLRAARLHAGYRNVDDGTREVENVAVGRRIVVGIRCDKRLGQLVLR